MGKIQTMRTNTFFFGISIIAALAPTPILAAASPAAVFAPSASDGLELVPVPDGRWEKTSIAGREAVGNVAGGEPAITYLYFRLEPGARSKAGGVVYAVVDYLDSGMGVARTQYNSSASAYSDGPRILMLGSGKWERAVLKFTDARLSGTQNGGADLRINGPPDLRLSRLEIYFEDPKIKLPDDTERIRMHLKTSPKPRGMFYTFGNDADAASAQLYHALGVTSIESYVTWETVEGKKEGEWDWSRWDEQVRVLKEHDLKWVPFLILGPAYSTPDWFRESSEHYGCRCLEHGTPSKVESLWNPNLPKRIDRFVAAFAERYGRSGVIESVLLGIQGDFGEAIYSVWGGGWTFDIPGEYHNHAGFWCDDPYALASFRKFVAARYKNAQSLNKAWGSSYAAAAEADFPGRGDDLKEFRERVGTGDPLARRRWLDFVDWYRECMTDWSDWWMAATRKHFPKTPIYLCTGGDAIPEHGSNFAEQCRVAAKHGAGVRITNEASDYGLNFSITRWVASAGKHYGAYFGFEPAGAEDEKGIAARIYNATASGANQLHDYNPNVVSSESRIAAQRRNLPWLFHVANPVVPVALWYPNVALTLKWGGYLQKAAEFRDFIDFDYVDESMLRTGALDRNRLLVVLHGDVMEPSDARLIAAWVRKGGRLLVTGVPRFESVEGTGEPEEILFGGSPNGRTIGKGKVARLDGLPALAVELQAAMDAEGLPHLDIAKDGVFWTQIAKDRFLTLDMNGEGTISEKRSAR